MNSPVAAVVAVVVFLRSGSFSSTIDASSCSLCPPNTYNTLPAQTGCASCEFAYFQSQQGKTSCQLCEAYGYPDGCPDNPHHSESSEQLAAAGIGIIGSLSLLSIVLALYGRKHQVRLCWHLFLGSEHAQTARPDRLTESQSESQRES